MISKGGAVISKGRCDDLAKGVAMFSRTLMYVVGRSWFLGLLLHL